MTTNNPDVDWVAHTQEEYEEADEPPESLKRIPSSNFRRTTIRRPSEQSSLLTKAIMGHSDDDLHIQHHEIARPILKTNYRRRSMASNISIASTADLTSDTGLTSPSRPNTPSPPLPEMSILPLDGDAEHKNVSLLGAAVRQHHGEVQKEAPRKRCIQFACAKPVVPEPPRPQPMIRAPSAQEPPRRSCIKFACPARPSSTQNTPPKQSMNQDGSDIGSGSPSTPRRNSALSVPSSLTPRQPVIRRHSVTRPAYLRADSKDLNSDGSQFHEFASGMSREADWIRRDSTTTTRRLTIDDTLTKENHIRRLAVEAEEEEEQENEDAEAALDDEDDEDELELDMDDEDEDQDDEDDDDDDDDDDVDDDSVGYHTDEETGFADSEEEDDDENMAMWTHSQKTVVNTGSVIRRPSLHEQQSDSSIATLGSQKSPRRTRAKRYRIATSPDLPDSTDFVCGTLDEDRPLEEAYLSCLAARRNEKLRLIPQDIDPSFPASDPDDDEAEIFNPVQRESDEEEWMHGEMEDLHHGQERRRRKSEQASPKRYRSPPPKRHHSPPPPKTRGRSPKPLFDRHSPRKIKSPSRKALTTPLGSPRCGQLKFNLAGRPGLTHTKSLPRAGAGFVLAQLKHSRRQKAREDDDLHIRGAVDIVKGLERKRQRRKEKFHQKYCNRARRGQIPERKPLPGLGAERMRELGLIMAGKKDQGNYVLSV